MKTFFTLMTLVTLFNGCSHYNAFSEFNITKNQEEGEENLLSSKIYGVDGVNGVVSSLYLNKVFPKRYKSRECFYVSMYIQNDKETIQFFLNKKPASKVTALTIPNEFSKIISFRGKWKEYFLVEFQKSDKKELKFSVKNSNSNSKEMLFKKGY